MQARMKNPAIIIPEAMQAIQALAGSFRGKGVPEETLALVHLRASQINGCSSCVQAGAAGARKAGESEDRLATVAAWREAPYFTDAERAALALTEAITRLAPACPGHRAKLGPYQVPEVSRPESPRDAAWNISAPSTVAASGIRRSTPVIHSSLRVCRWAQTACRLPPCSAARRAVLTSAPRPAESMNVTRFRSTISVPPLSASSNSRSRSWATVEMSISPVTAAITTPRSLRT